MDFSLIPSDLFVGSAVASRSLGLTSVKRCVVLFRLARQVACLITKETRSRVRNHTDRRGPI